MQQNKKIPNAFTFGNLLEVTTRFELVDEGFADHFINKKNNVNSIKI